MLACIMTTMQLHAGVYERFLFQRSINNMDRFLDIDRNLARYPKQATPGRKLFPARNRHTHNQEKNELITELIQTYKHLSDDDKKRDTIQNLFRKLYTFEQTYNVKIQDHVSHVATIIGMGIFLTVTVSIIINAYIFLT
jgi:hypothetical protein